MPNRFPPEVRLRTVNIIEVCSELPLYLSCSIHVQWPELAGVGPSSKVFAGSRPEFSGQFTAEVPAGEIRLGNRFSHGAGTVTSGYELFLLTEKPEVWPFFEEGETLWFNSNNAENSGAVAERRPHRRTLHPKGRRLLSGSALLYWKLCRRTEDEIWSVIVSGLQRPVSGGGTRYREDACGSC